MASLVPGYEYDIFISYRQKDNKHDGWVTEFVNNLKGELESTFKEEISVYFDINPHDGLLETHDVGESLKEKLKCLVFIPIISRTYCDPKSFAWEYEFRAFVDLTFKDQFGLKVKLPNGNVASRILPVRIYDLDPADIRLCESALGGVLRGVDFIYKSAGVNRPLRQKEENPQENLNHTIYRDQINKVANAIKEIISALGQNIPEQEEIPKEVLMPVNVSRKKYKPAIISGLIITLILIILGFIFIPGLIKPKTLPEKSIAVLPFTLLSDEPDKQYLADGMMDAITFHLSKIRDLRVPSRTTTEQYRGSGKTMTEIGRELGVTYLLEGSFHKYGNDVKLIVRLFQTGKEAHVWTNQYDREWVEILSVQSEVAQTIAGELNAVITPEEKQLIEKAPTQNLIAYNYYLIAREAEGGSPYNALTSFSTIWSDFIPNIKKEEILSRELAEKMYKKALEYDSTFAAAYTGLAGIYWSRNFYKEYFSEHFLDSVMFLADKALSFDGEFADAHFIKGMYYSETGLSKQAFEEFDKTLKLNPNYWMAYLGKGILYINEDNYVKAIENLQRADFLHHGPGLPAIRRHISMALYSGGFNELASTYYFEAVKLETDSAKYFFGLYSSEGDNQKGYEFLLKGYKIDSTDFRILLGLTRYFEKSGQFKEAIIVWRKYLKSLDEQGVLLINNTHRMGYVYSMLGDKDSADYFFNKQIGYCSEAIRLHRPYGYRSAYYDLAGIYAFKGNKIKAYENLNILNQKGSKNNWLLDYLETDYLFSSIRNEPQFKKIFLDMKTETQAEHERVKKWLEKTGML